MHNEKISNVLAFLACIFSAGVAHGVPCWDKGQIEKYESGKLKSCLLTTIFTIQGVECARGTDIYLYESGRLKQCVQASSFFLGINAEGGSCDNFALREPA